MIRSAAAAFALVCAAALPASAQAPSGTGDMASAPRSVAKGGATVETAPAARTRARARTRSRTHAAGTASAGSAGPDATAGAGSAAPGGPGSPPPTLPVGPGTAPSSAGATPGPGGQVFEATFVRA